MSTDSRKGHELENAGNLAKIERARALANEFYAELGSTNFNGPMIGGGAAVAADPSLLRITANA
jgi:hypothetical protein